jgi:3-phosphoshikimate 1-carboxyvinyltransferase
VLIESRSKLKGEVTVPGDKSISFRAIVFGALASGTTEIDNILLSEDCISAIDCFRKMQVSVEIQQQNRVKVHGKGIYGLQAPSSALNVGRSGTALRLLLGVLCGQPFSSGLVRNDSSMKKPVGNVVDYLKQMGAVISGKDDGNFCPLSISPAVLKGTSFDLSIHETHIKSPLILAGLYADGDTVIREAVKSRDHTELMLNYFGADIKTNGLEVTSHAVENLYARHVSIPGDISMASHFFTAALLVPDSEVVVRNVGVNPTRAGIIDIYKSMGAKIEYLDERFAGNEKVADIHVVSSPLTGVKIDGRLVPNIIDELPVIIVAAAYAQGATEITGLSGFKIKESGKIKALTLELTKMGAKITETEDGLVIEGKEKLKGTVVDSGNNHSLAMALTVASLAATGETLIRKTQAVDIVYPEFFETFNKL